jgi:hypothetical protein
MVVMKKPYHVRISVTNAFLLGFHVEKICRQEQLGSLVVIKCPPDGMLLLNECCNDNGKIVCCTYEDFIHREDGQRYSAHHNNHHHHKKRMLRV